MRVQHRHSRSRSMFPQPARHVLFVFTLFAMILGPALAGTVVSAGEEAPASEEPVLEEVVDEPTEEPVLEELVEPTEAPTETPAETATLTITKALCDTPGFDPYEALTAQDLSDNCAAPSGDATFTVSNGMGYSDTQGTSGSVVEFEIPAGQVTISEVVPAGYDEPVAACVSSASGPAGLIFTDGGSATVTVDPGDAFTCTWYNVVPPTLGDLTIIKWLCPEGYDHAAESAVPPDNCTMPLDGVTFTLSSADPAFVEIDAETSAGNPSAAVFEDVPGGQYTVTETLPDGMASSFIWVCSVEGSLIELPDDPLAEGTTLNVRVIPGENVICHWFNVPGTETPGGTGEPEGTEGPGTETPDGTEIPGEGRDVHILKYTCPLGIDPDDDVALLQSCEEDVDPVEFTVSNESGYTESVTASAGVPQTADFSNVPFGNIILIETVPIGYAEPVVSCWDTSGGALGNSTRVPVEFGNTVAWEHRADAEADLTCVFFNFEAEPSDLIIYKWTCPEGYDPYAGDANPFDDCTEGPDGVTFHLGGPATDLQSTTGDTMQSAVHFEGIAAGSYTITETVPEGIAATYLWGCYEPAQGLDSLPAQDGPAAEGSSWEYQADGVTRTCHVLNVPGRETTVTISKYVCPEGTTYDHDLEWYDENCQANTDDIQFSLTTVDGTSYAYPELGYLQWTGVPTGPIGIQEYLPAEYGEPVVYCSINGSELEQYEVNAGHIGHESFGQSGDASDYRFSCVWFNIPGSPSEITISKYTCPEGYDLYAHGANPVEDCPEATDGVTFHLGGPATDAQGETGDAGPGAVTFDELGPGAYTVTETVPEGTAYVFVLDCYGQNQGELRPYPLSVGETLDIHVSAGESIACSWYNVPEDPDGRLTVVKHTCTTDEYESDIDCEIEEDGITFDLVWWNGDAWEFAAEGTTGVAGTFTWHNLEPGEYWLDEHDAEWCHLASEEISDDGNWLNVYASQETVVHVYNCDGEPGKPGKTPTKYPNTGVPPTGGTAGGPVDLPSFVPYAGLLAGLTLVGAVRSTTPGAGVRPDASVPVANSGRRPS